MGSQKRLDRVIFTYVNGLIELTRGQKQATNANLFRPRLAEPEKSCWRLFEQRQNL